MAAGHQAVGRKHRGAGSPHLSRHTRRVNLLQRHIRRRRSKGLWLFLVDWSATDRSYGSTGEVTPLQKTVPGMALCLSGIALLPNDFSSGIWGACQERPPEASRGTEHGERSGVTLPITCLVREVPAGERTQVPP